MRKSRITYTQPVISPVPARSLRSASVGKYLCCSRPASGGAALLARGISVLGAGGWGDVQRCCDLDHFTHAEEARRSVEGAALMELESCFFCMGALVFAALQCASDVRCSVVSSVARSSPPAFTSSGREAITRLARGARS